MSRGAKILLIAAGVLVLVLVYGIVVEPRLVDERQITATVPKLPSAWEGEQVAFVSDLQLGIVLANEGTAREMVERILAADPAIVLLGGDFAYKYPFGGAAPAEQVETTVDIFRPLVKAGILTYAVLGNHDYASAVADALTRALERAGIPVLANEAVTLPAPGGAGTATDPLYLAGIAPLLPGRAQPAEALSAVPQGAPRIVLMHTPNVFDEIPSGTAPFAIAGHTHGGQLRMPFAPQWSYLSLFSEERITSDGWIPGFGQPGNHLFVNRGVGMAYIPLRLSCLPELTYVTLRRG